MINDELQHMDLFQRGYDAFGQSPLKYIGAEINIKAKTMYEAGLPSNFIQSGDMISTLDVGNGNVKIDGENKRIIINDGVNDRVLIGYGQGLF